MTVKEVFDLRKQGRIEEAYDAIRPMYAAHKGRYTTLCMFWTAADVFKLRLEQGRVEEAEKILQALKRMLPRVEAINKELDTQYATSKKEEPKYPWEHDKPQQEGSSAAAFLATATRRLEKAQKGMRDKKAPLGATDYSRGCKPTVTVPPSHPEPRRGDTTPSHPCSTKEEPKAEIRVDSLNPCSKPINEQLTDNFPDKREKIEAGLDIPSGRKVNEVSSRQLTSKEETPSGENICVIRGISVTKEEASAAGEISAISAISAEQEEETISVPEDEIPNSQILDRKDPRLTDLNAHQRIVLACLVAHPGYSVPQISASTGIPAKSIERHISALIEHNLIEHCDSKKTGGYYAI